MQAYNKSAANNHFEERNKNKETHHHIKTVFLYRRALRRETNWGTGSANLTSSRRSFHSAGAETAKALSPFVPTLDSGTRVGVWVWDSVWQSLISVRFTLKEKQSEAQAATVWLLCFGVARRDFERVTGGLTPACWVDVGVVRVHPLIVDVTPAVIMDLREKTRGRRFSQCENVWYLACKLLKAPTSPHRRTHSVTLMRCVSTSSTVATLMRPGLLLSTASSFIWGWKPWAARWTQTQTCMYTQHTNLGLKKTLCAPPHLVSSILLLFFLHTCQLFLPFEWDTVAAQT